MIKTTLASLAVAFGLLTAPLLSPPAEAQGLRKALKIGATVAVTGLVIRCGVRSVKGKSCL